MSSRNIPPASCHDDFDGKEVAGWVNFHYFKKRGSKTGHEASMKIAQIAPLFESVPPQGYGGTERIVSYLTEELIRQGHELTLFASADSQTSAHLIKCSPRSLRLDAQCKDPIASHLLMVEQVFHEAHRFDILHFHIDYLHFPLCRREKVPVVTTLHGREDIPELKPLYQEYREMSVISISNAQREPLPWAHWEGTVYHGLPQDLYRLHQTPHPYLAFLGRCSPEKGLAPAIELARRADIPLKIAAKIDEKDQEYFRVAIKPQLKNPGIEFIGEIGEKQKEDFLGHALALLFPIDWPEPFGIVMIEAMACGTPVIAYPRGSVSEVMVEGVTGFVVESFEEALWAIGRIPEIDRRKCREIFDERFTAGRMAQDYLKIYERVIQK